MLVSLLDAPIGLRIFLAGSVVSHAANGYITLSAETRRSQYGETQLWPRERPGAADKRRNHI